MKIQKIKKMFIVPVLLIGVGIQLVGCTNHSVSSVVSNDSIKVSKVDFLHQGEVVTEFHGTDSMGADVTFSKTDNRPKMTYKWIYKDTGEVKCEDDVPDCIVDGKTPTGFGNGGKFLPEGTYVLEIHLKDSDKLVGKAEVKNII